MLDWSLHLKLDRCGALKIWLKTLMSPKTYELSGNHLCDLAIQHGYKGDCVEYAEPILTSFEHAKLIIRCGPDPKLEKSARAMSDAWSFVRFEEKRRCFMWIPSSLLNQKIHSKDIEL